MKPASDKPAILFFIQLPPPVHGVSIMNELLYSNQKINSEYRKYLLKLDFSKKFEDIRQLSLRKIIKSIWLVFKLSFKLIKVKPQLVYFSFMPVGIGFFRDALYLLVIKCFKKKVLLHLDNRGILNHTNNKIRRWLYNITLRNTNIIHLSEKLVETELVPLKLRNLNYFVVPNAVKEVKYTYDNKQDKDIVDILFLSNLMPQKGIFIAIDIFKDLYEKHQHIRLHIIGQPVKRVPVRIPEKISKNVVFHGALFGYEKYKILSNADIFIFPSFFGEECMPLSIIEAMQFELPVIATNNGAVNELIQHNYNGYLPEIGEWDTFKTYLEKLIIDSELRNKMGLKSRDIYEKKFTSAIFERNMLNVFNKLINV
ncbi:MAG: glycosyltransferase family 4 protein [Bacteroidales bacterium]|nr:glycosyltransferase family 4 protein [Bacteroidales bacterium]MBN2817824.1 glycosyltransferase family 4 protein [Bacteroidales bacterium]